MIWHVVHFDMSSLNEEQRTELESHLRGLASLDCVRWLVVERDLDVPGTTGLLSTFDTYEDLEIYRTHPDHQVVIGEVRGHGIQAIRVDIDAPMPAS